MEIARVLVFRLYAAGQVFSLALATSAAVGWATGFSNPNESLKLAVGALSVFALLTAQRRLTGWPPSSEGQPRRLKAPPGS